MGPQPPSSASADALQLPASARKTFAFFLGSTIERLILCDRTRMGSLPLPHRSRWALASTARLSVQPVIAVSLTRIDSPPPTHRTSWARTKTGHSPFLAASSTLFGLYEASFTREILSAVLIPLFVSFTILAANPNIYIYIYILSYSVVPIRTARS